MQFGTTIYAQLCIYIMLLMSVMNSINAPTTYFLIYFLLRVALYPIYLIFTVFNIYLSDMAF